MKKLLFILMATMLLVACGNEYEADNAEKEEKEEKEEEEEEEEEIETLLNKNVELILSDNDDLRVTLLQVNHGRSETTDHVSLKVSIENKQNKTYELILEEFKIDGRNIDLTRIWLSDAELKPNKVIETYINAYDYEELTVDEHVAGSIIYKDYDGNREKISFSEYINE